MRKIEQPTLKNLLNRYHTNKRMLEEHPEYGKLLNRKIEENKQDILDHVLSDDFARKLEIIDL